MADLNFDPSSYISVKENKQGRFSLKKLTKILRFLKLRMDPVAIKESGKWHEMESTMNTQAALLDVKTREQNSFCLQLVAAGLMSKKSKENL